MIETLTTIALIFGPLMFCAIGLHVGVQIGRTQERQRCSRIIERYARGYNRTVDSIGDQIGGKP